MTHFFEISQANQCNFIVAIVRMFQQSTYQIVFYLSSDMIYTELKGKEKSGGTLTNNKILDVSKLKAFKDHKTNVTEKWNIVLERTENIVGKGENAAQQHFLLFLQCFQKASFFLVIKKRDCLVKIKRYKKL